MTQLAIVSTILIKFSTETTGNNQFNLIITVGNNVLKVDNEDTRTVSIEATLVSVMLTLTTFGTQFLTLNI